MSRNDFHDVRVLLTGASSGLGRELALLLAKAGANVLATARRGEKLESLASASTGGIHHLAGDITSADFRASLMQTCIDRMHGVDLLINNAGAGSIDQFAESTPEHFRQLVELNLIAPVELTRLCLPLLRKSKRGQIVNVCSVLSYFGAANKSSYCATKFALRGFSDALRSELKHEGIAVTVLNPSTIASEFWEAIETNSDTNTQQAKQAGAKGLTPQRAAELSFHAIRKFRAEATFPLSGRLLVWAARWFPGVLRFFADRR